MPQDRDNKNANFEKEHIIASNESSAIIESEDVNKRRLGNFVLLRPSVNKAIQDAPLYEKLIEYKNNSHKYLTPRSLAEIEILYGRDNVDKKSAIYTRDFLVEFLDRREEKLVNFALERWGFGNPKHVKLDSKYDDLRVYKITD